MRFLSVLFILFIISYNELYGQSRVDLEKQRNSTLKEISETENVLKDIRKNKEESLEVLSLIDKKINARNNLISNISKDLNKVDENINETEINIQLLNTDILTIKEEYAKVIWISYLNRQKLNHLMYILSSSDINQAYRRLKYLKQYTDYRKQQIRAISNVKTDLAKKVQLLAEQKSEKQKLIKKNESEKILLSEELNDKTKIVASLKKRERELTAKIKTKNKLVDKIKFEIETLIRREIAENKARAARATKKSKTSSNKKVENINTVNILTPDELSLSASFKDNMGKLPWPTERGIITGFFGIRSHPVYKTLKIRNNGIDISTTEGSYVRAVFDGEVRFIIPILGANYSILVRHGNFYTVYTNIVEINVKVGSKVKTRQVLGKVFTDKNTNSTILHMEVWDNLKVLDPELWLSKN